MYEMQKFKICHDKPKDVEPYGGVSKCMDIFQRVESQFLPPGKDFADLTKEEADQVKRQYRFDYYKPGVYQAITGLGNMM